MDKDKQDNVNIEEQDSVTMTKEEYAAALQAESDKRVTQALKTAKAKWEAEVDTKINSHLKDYEKKAQMTPEQLAQMEIDDKLRALEEKEKEYTRKTREVEIAQKLQEKNLSSVLTKFVYSDKMEEVEQNIATLEQLVLGMVNEQIEQRISSNKPKAVNAADVNKEKFQKMNLAERNEIYQQNPELFKELMG